MLGIANIEGIFVDRVSRKMKVFVVSRTDGLFRSPFVFSANLQLVASRSPKDSQSGSCQVNRLASPRSPSLSS
jgi:hypothetical protein